ncbi:MAG: hypothetical protein JNN13_13065 [Planctomycetes bacterium]|nr:hypothetical protein [Planctomycetota bacterium]
MRCLPLVLFPLLIAAVPAQKINDTVIKKDGAKVRGVEVKEFLLTGVRGKRGGDDFEIPAHLVAGIEWSDLPEQFLAGRGAMERGDFRTAAQMFGDVQSDRALVKADATFFQIKAAVASIGADKGAAATAADRAKAWLGANPNHWRTPEALLLCGRAQRLAGTGGEAATTLRELDDRAGREGLGAVWSARAKSELALTLMADGKAADARISFQTAGSAIDNALKSPSGDEAELLALKTMARVGEGETFLAEKDYARAETYFKGLTSDKQPAIAAAGHAGQGEAIFLVAVAKNDSDAIRRAQLELARASVLDASSGEASAKANYYLGRCLLALGADKEGDTFKQRANAYFQIVATSYASTRWAAVAKAEMAK